MKLSVVIVDDEDAGRCAVREACRQFSDVEVVGECDSGAEAVRLIGQLRPTIAFLDIQMKPISGIETAASLAAEDTPLIVFVTAYDKYAVKAFELNAVDYLLKPLDMQRFADTLERIRSRVHGILTPDMRKDVRRLVLAVARELQETSSAQDAERFIIEVAGKVSVVDPRDIEYVEVDRNYVVISAKLQQYRVRATLGDIERRLAMPSFMRIHRSVIINVGKTRSIDKAFHGEYHVEMLSGKKFVSGRVYRQRIRGVLLRARVGSVEH